jgi:uncharacterized protein DUF1552
MIITRKSLPRRTFLRGIGTTLALPLLDAMAPALAATRTTAAKPACRMAFVYVPNGVIMEQWRPAAEGAGFELTPILKALAPYRERLLVLSGLAQVNGRPLGDGPGDHARAGATFLTGVHPKKTEGVDIHAGVSVDQIAAKELGKHTQLPSLEVTLEATGMVGNCDSGYSCAYTNTISWRTPTAPMPMEVNPRAVFERLFGDGDSTDAASRAARAREERSILDSVREEVAHLGPGLGPRDRNKLTDYLDAIRDIERRIGMVEKQNASIELPVIERPMGVPATFEEHAKLMFDLQVIAFQADLTRVISTMMGREGSNRTYRAIGVPDPHHGISHHQGDKEKIEKLARINTHHAEMFAYFLEKLRSTPDGDGSLLDHSMIVYGSSLSDGNMHTHEDLPVLLVGGGAGQIRGGRHIRFPKETPLTNLYLSMLDKIGVPAESIGDSTGGVEHLSDV